MKTIDITFAIAAYNAAPFIEEAVVSVLSQTVRPIEVIVVDDGSTDTTATIVRTLIAQDERLRLIQSQCNAGPAAARNKALSVARGTWFAIVDADDLIAPGRSHYLLDLALSSGADIAADNIEQFCDRTGRTISTILKSCAEPYCFLIDAVTYLEHNIMFSAGMKLGYLKPMFRTSFLRKHGLTYSEKLWNSEDFDFCLRCLLAGARFMVTSNCFYRYRVREGSLSWRLKSADTEKLIEAVRATMDRNKGATFNHAASSYVKALERARAHITLVDSLKQHCWREAFHSVHTRLDLLPLLSASAYAHFSKRFSQLIEISED